MIKFWNTDIYGFEHAIRGMRNPKESWDRSDSAYKIVNINDVELGYEPIYEYIIGPNDLELMNKLVSAGTDHRKFMRQIIVWVDITAPLYWWKEADTYKVGTVANSTSTMHCIHKKDFTIDDFSTEHMINYSLSDMNRLIELLNTYRDIYVNWDTQHEHTKALYDNDKKKVWWQIIQLLPTSYNQTRTVMLSYEVLANMYHSRKNHKLDEWSIGFCDWVKSLPYSELITGEKIC